MKEAELKKFHEWRIKADEDFKSADILIKNDGVPATISFLAQQGAEKYLKGFLAFHNRPILKIHLLDKRLEDCISIDASFKNLIDEAVALNDYYIESRYPDNIREDIKMEEAKNAFNMAAKIKNVIIEKVIS